MALGCFQNSFDSQTDHLTAYDLLYGLYFVYLSVILCHRLKFDLQLEEKYQIKSGFESCQTI